jgi:hypothetical protein
MPGPQNTRLIGRQDTRKAQYQDRTSEYQDTRTTVLYWELGTLGNHGTLILRYQHIRIIEYSYTRILVYRARGLMYSTLGP